MAAQLPQLETPRALVHGAVAISRHALEDADPLRCDLALQALADRVHARVRSGTPEALLAHAHQVLFDEDGFAGDDHDYYDPDHSYLPVVLRRHRGIPITLCLVYKAVLERLGLAVQGVNSPGHFLARVEARGGELFIDPFHAGKAMSRNEALLFLAHRTGRSIDPQTALLPASNRQWLHRMLQNLLAVFQQLAIRRHVAAMQELEQLLMGPR